MAKNETQITTKQNEELQLSELANEFSGAVMVRSEILKVARLKLANAMSHASSGGLAKPGEFTCEVSNKNYGTKVAITPLLISESASLLSEDGSILCSSNDLLVNRDGIACKNCPFGQYHSDWGTKQEKKVPKCRLAIDVACLVNDEKEPMIFSFRKTSYQAGKELANQVIRDPKRVPFGSSYTLTSEQGTKDKYKWFFVSPSLERKELPMEAVVAIVPIAKKVLEAKRKGLIEHEVEVDSDIPF